MSQRPRLHDSVLHRHRGQARPHAGAAAGFAAVQAAVGNRTSGPLPRARTGAGPDRRVVHRFVCATARAAGIGRPIGPHALRRTVGTAGLNQGIPLRDIWHLLRHSRPGTTVASCDVNGDALERHAPHQVAGFLAGWAG